LRFAVWLSILAILFTGMMSTYYARIEIANTLTRLVGGPRVTFIGDSITRGGGIWDIRLGRFPIYTVNYGTSGATVREILAKTKLEINDINKSRVVIVMAGSNDVKPAVSPCNAQLADAIAAYIELFDVLDASQAGRIVVMSTPPQSDTRSSDLAHQLNNQIKKAIKGRKKFLFVDLWPLISAGGTIKPEMTIDGLHFSEASYIVWRNALRDLD